MKLTNKQIANELREVAKNYPEVTFIMKKEIVYRNGTFKVRCIESAEAIRKVADRFEKGVKNIGFDPGVLRYQNHRESAKLILNRYKDDPDLDQFKMLFE